MSNSNLPLVGSVIVFSTVPNGSWATTGIKYRVDAIEGEAVFIRRTGTFHVVFSASWAYAFAKWEAVA